MLKAAERSYMAKKIILAKVTHSCNSNNLATIKCVVLDDETLLDPLARQNFTKLGI